MLPFVFAEGSGTKLLVAMENPLDIIAMDGALQEVGK